MRWHLAFPYYIFTPLPILPYLAPPAAALIISLAPAAPACAVVLPDVAALFTVVEAYTPVPST